MATTPARSNTLEDKVIRALQMITFVKENGPTPFTDLARVVGRTAKQVDREWRKLSLVGRANGMPHELLDIDWVAYEDGIAALISDLGLHQFRLNSAEALVTLSALAKLARIQPGPAVASASEKVRAALEVPAEVSFPDWGEQQGEPTSAEYQVLVQAIETRHQVEITYLARSEATVRVIEPFRFSVADSAVYLQAYCHLRQDFRDFRLDRISTVMLLDAEQEQTPPEQSLEREIKYVADLRIAKGVRWLFENLPGVTFAAIDGADDWQVALPVFNEEFVVDLLLPLGEEVIVQAPLSLKTKVISRAEQILAAWAR